VYNLGTNFQLVDFVYFINLAHPKFTDKYTMLNLPKLLDLARDKSQVKHYSIRAKCSYTSRIKRYN